jgi:hypothetical protein
MSWHMITASQLNDLSVPERLFTYADSYRNAASLVCTKIADDPRSFSWPDAAVVLMLAAHAVELFLKGALLKRCPDDNVFGYKHRLGELSAAYRRRFTEPSFDWDIPFQLGEWPDGITEQEKKLLGNTPEPSILYRYPVDTKGGDWEGLYGFEPHSFLTLLHQLGQDFKVIKSQLTDQR